MNAYPGLDACPRCDGSLIENDRYPERLIGCIECNRWTWPTSENVSMELPEEDIARSTAVA